MKAIHLDASCGRTVPHVYLPRIVFAWLAETMFIVRQNKRNARELESLPDEVLKDFGYRIPEAVTAASGHGKINDQRPQL